MKCNITPIDVCQCDSDEQCKAKIEIDRLTVQLADRDTELKRQTGIVEDAEQSYFRIVDKYNSRADQILQLQTENATLLEEVERLEKHNASSDQAIVELDQQLTIATEALEEIDRIKQVEFPKRIEKLRAEARQDAARTIERHLLGMFWCIPSKENEPMIYRDEAIEWLRGAFKL